MLIDEKGRLFGKINIIDLIIIVILISIFPVLMYAQKILSYKQPPPPKPPINYILTPIEIYCNFVDVKEDVSHLISVGDKEADKDNKVFGEILEIIDEDEHTERYPMGRGYFIDVNGNKRKNIFVKLRILPALNGETYMYKDVGIGLDTVINFKTDEYDVKGVIVPPPYKKEWINVNIRIKEVPDNILSLIKEGDIEKDQNGMVIGRLKEIKDIDKSTRLIYIPSEVRYGYVDYPDHKNLLLSIDVLIDRRKDGIYSKNTKLLIGRGYSFESEKYILNSYITELLPN